MKYITILLSLSLAFLMSACSVKKDMDHMRESTDEVKEATKEMKKMNGVVRDRIEDSYHGGREDVGMNMLRDSFNEVLKGGDKDVVRKLEYSYVYFGSFEFQHWQGDFEDTQRRREYLMSKAIELFFAEIDDLIEDSHPVSILNIMSDAYQNWLVLSVMSLAMDKIHPNQEFLSEKLGFKKYSVLSMLEEGLARKAEAEAGKPVPEFVRFVLEREQEAIYMLQLRHNFVPLLVLGNMTDFEEGLFPKLKRFFPWTLDLTNANEMKRQFWIRWLQKSESTRAFLQSINVPLKKNSMSEMIFNRNTKVLGLEDSPQITETELRSKTQLRKLIKSQYGM